MIMETTMKRKRVLKPYSEDTYTPEEAYALVMEDVKSIYGMKDAV